MSSTPLLSSSSDPTSIWPCVGDRQGEMAPRTEEEARVSPHGRPPHALLAFGLGGRAVLLRLRPAGGLAPSGRFSDPGLLAYMMMYESLVS